MSDSPRIDFKSGKFEANGNTYYIDPALTITRYEKFEAMSMQLAFGTDFEGVFNMFKDIYMKLTSGNEVLKALRDGSTVAFNAMSSIKDFIEKENEHPTLMLCTVFCNLKGEDTTKWSEHLAKEKIEDWREAGIPMEDFFLLAANVLGGYKAAYNLILEQADKSQAIQIPQIKKNFTPGSDTSSAPKTSTKKSGPTSSEKDGEGQ